MSHELPPPTVAPPVLLCGDRDESPHPANTDANAMELPPAALRPTWVTAIVITWEMRYVLLVLILVLGSPELRGEVSAALAALEVEVTCALDVAAASRALRTSEVALLLVDWSMADAAQHCRALAAASDGSETALLAVSDERDPARLAAMLAAGASDVLALPADRPRLVMRALQARDRPRDSVDARLYRRVFERNPLPMCLINDDTGQFLAVSDGAIEQYGWSREEFLQMLLRDVRPPEFVPQFEEVTGRPDALVVISTTHWRKDGTRFSSHGVLQRFVVGDRRLRFAVSRDVTEELRLAEAHRRAATAYERLVERSADGVFNHRADDFTITYANPAFIAFLGYAGAEALLGRSILDFVTPADVPRVRERVSHIVASRQPSQPGPFRFVGHDGAIKWAETRGYLGADDERVVTVVVRDLTERRRVEEALRRSEDRFSRIFHATPAAISITRLSDGVFVDVNERFVSYTGLTREDVLGKTGVDVGIWEDGGTRQKIYDAVNSQGGVRDVEVRLRKKGGELIDGLMSAERVDVSGEPCFLATTVDISERKALEEQLRHAHKMEAVGRLAGGIAHDFNNLLTAIRGYSELLLEHTSAAPFVRDAAQHIHRSALRAASLTEQLLIFTRRRPVTLEVVDLDALVRPLGVMLARTIVGNITVELQLGCAGGRVRAAPAQLEQVILNLAVNARDAMPRGGRLVIATDAFSDGNGKRHVRLRVTDSGVGMDERVRTRIFEPFFTTKEVGRGTGLGLAIVYGIVEQSGGTISVETAPGRGARFEILLPAVQEALAAGVHEEVAASAPGGNELVLLVEDEEDVRGFVQLVLRRAGYQLLVADSGARAIELARQRMDLQLLVSDVVMPHMNGHELAGRLRELLPTLPVLYISGYASSDSDGNEAVPALRKPFSAAELLRGVRAALDR